MKLKNIKGLLPEKKESNSYTTEIRAYYNHKGYNQAIDEIGEINIKLDEEKIYKICTDVHFKYKEDVMNSKKVAENVFIYIARALVNADIVKEIKWNTNYLKIYQG